MINNNLPSIAVALLLTAACGEKAREPDPPADAPARATQAPRSQIDFESLIGIATPRPSGVMCVAIPATLSTRDAITLVSVPIAPAKLDSTPAEYSSVLAARITGSGEQECGTKDVGYGLRQPGDSLYTATIVRDTARLTGVFFAVVIPFDAFFRVGHAAGARMSQAGDVLNFRMCTSGEGLHLTAWDGKPISGARVWHRYFYLGYDTQPTCLEKDTG